MKRFFYFLTDRLQITYYERLSVLTLGGIFILLLVINQLYRPAPAFSEDHYAEIIADFHERVQVRDAAQQELLARYYPEPARQSLPEMADNPEAAFASAGVPASEIRFPSSGTVTNPENDPTESTSPALSAVGDIGASHPQARNTSSPLSPDTKININTAEADELVKLPGIGPAIAARIIEYRTEHGPFQEISEIKNVRGIGEARFEAIKDFITTEREN